MRNAYTTKWEFVDEDEKSEGTKTKEKQQVDFEIREVALKKACKKLCCVEKRRKKKFYSNMLINSGSEVAAKMIDGGITF